MRKALIVGIDNYHSLATLDCCVNDAMKMQELLEVNDDGTTNFDIKTLIDDEATTLALEEEIANLFDDEDVEIGLFYFSGHGIKENKCTYLLTVDGSKRSLGVSLEHLMNQVNSAKCKYKIVILDCCSSGAIGKNALFANNMFSCGEGVVIMTSCKDSSKALDENGHGVFTGLIINALDGYASDILGNVSILTMYHYVASCLGAWKQRPTLKCNISPDLLIRKAEPLIPLKTLKNGLKLFESEDDVIELDATFYNFTKGFDPVSIKPVKENEKKFNLLLQLEQARLLRHTHSSLFITAKNGGQVSLSKDGKYYWSLVSRKII